MEALPKKGLLIENFVPREQFFFYLNPIALRMAKTPWSFGCSECNKVKDLTSSGESGIPEILEVENLEVENLDFNTQETFMHIQYDQLKTGQDGMGLL